MAYFYYPTGKKPFWVPRAELITVFPEMKYSAGLRSGTTVRLKYYDDAHPQGTERFPAGVTVGWAIYQKDIWNAPTFYSLKSLNLDKKNHNVLFRDKGNELLIFGFEDWYLSFGDKDFNDVLFSVKANPFKAVDNEDIPDLDDPDEDNVTKKETVSGTLLFEDLYPYEEIMI